MENKKIRMPIAAILLAASVLVQLLTTNLRHLSVLGYITIAANVFICYVLFTKKRDNMLIYALGAGTVMSLIGLLMGFNLATLLSFLANAALLAYAVSVSEQTLLKVDLSQIKTLGDKFYYAPAALLLLAKVISVSNMFKAIGLAVGGGLYALGFVNVFSSIFSILVGCGYMLTLASWLKDPYANAAVPVGETGSVVGGGSAVYGDAYCSLGKHIVLCLFTFGIWPLIWTHRTTKFLNCAPGATYYDPTKKLLLCMFVPFYQLYWYYKHGQRIDALSREKGLNNSDMATMCLVLGIFIPIVATILMQDRINSICMKIAAEEI